jgi:hypothetical protein
MTHLPSIPNLTLEMDETLICSASRGVSSFEDLWERAVEMIWAEG